MQDAVQKNDISHRAVIENHFNPLMEHFLEPLIHKGLKKL